MAEPDYETMRDNLVTAYNTLAVGTVQSYTMPGGRTLTYKDTQKILDEIKELNSLVAQTKKGGAKNFASFVRPV